MVLFYFLTIVAATWIGAVKNRPVLGFFMGFLLGLIGVLIMAVVKTKEVENKSNSNFYYNPSNPEHQAPQSQDKNSMFKD